MLAEERFQLILQLVKKRTTVTVQELTDYLGSSESTVRRDLTTLHNRGKLIKIHGGATVPDDNYSTRDASISAREDLNREEKILIAKYAAALIRPNDFVYIDAGTSTALMLDYIAERQAVFVTDAPSHAKKLAEKGCTVYVLGGELKLTTEALVGAETVNALRKYNFTKGFFGTNAINLHTGFSTPDVDEAEVKARAMLQCKIGYVLADPSKFGKNSSVTFAGFTDATIITTALKHSSYSGCKNILEVSKK